MPKICHGATGLGHNTLQLAFLKFPIRVAWGQLRQLVARLRYQFKRHVAASTGRQRD